ncbi:MAG: hypothetical protein H7Y04_11795 [Verrucomicrobia bacterium]|nr:hypothetical protein [Cytophagales bacterium]
MQAFVSQQILLKDIPSASGIECLQEKLYIIGDNTAYMFVLDTHKNFIARKRILPFTASAENVIPKKQKPDFEALTALSSPYLNQLLVLGSGSQSPERDKAFLIDTENLFEEVKTYSLTGIYDFLRSLPEVAEGYRLNIEAATVAGDKIYLFQRGNISGNNVMIRYKIPDFLDFMTGKSTKQPMPSIFAFNLPEMAGLRAGFSGACTLDEHTILFTASVEDTADEIEDGATLGSFVGLIDLRNLQKTPICLPVLCNNETFTGKIESITMIAKQNQSIEAVAVTDSDGGDSWLLELEIRL